MADDPLDPICAALVDVVRDVTPARARTMAEGTGSLSWRPLRGRSARRFTRCNPLDERETTRRESTRPLEGGRIVTDLTNDELGRMQNAVEELAASWERCIRLWVDDGIERGFRTDPAGAVMLIIAEPLRRAVDQLVGLHLQRSHSGKAYLLKGPHGDQSDVVPADQLTEDEWRALSERYRLEAEELRRYRDTSGSVRLPPLLRDESDDFPHDTETGERH